MKLAVCGCSWSSRDPNYPDTEFGYFISKDLDWDYKNYGRVGCDNFSIRLQVDQAIKNIQETVNTYVKAVDKYARRVYNTDPILSLEQFKNNLSLNKLVDIIDKVIAIKADILIAKIKVRKARDLTTAANAAAQVPVPNLSLAAEYTERATQYTANELKQLQDLRAAFLIITELKKQIDTLPQLASQYLHKEKVDLAEIICKYMEDKYGVKGRVHFNVGGAQAIEDSLKVVRNHTGKTHQFAFMGGYHGRTLGASAITSSYRYRRRFGNFADRAQFIPYPYCFRCPYSMKVETCDTYCHKEFEKLFV